MSQASGYGGQLSGEDGEWPRSSMMGGKDAKASSKVFRRQRLRV